MYDILDKQLLNGRTNGDAKDFIDVSQFEIWIYFVRLELDGKIETLKFVKCAELTYCLMWCIFTTDISSVSAYEFFLLVLSEYEHLWFTGIPYSLSYSNIASWDAFRFNFQVQVYIQSCFLEGLRPFVDSSIRLFCAR